MFNAGSLRHGAEPKHMLQKQKLHYTRSQSVSLTVFFQQEITCGALIHLLLPELLNNMFYLLGITRTAE